MSLENRIEKNESKELEELIEDINKGDKSPEAFINEEKANKICDDFDDFMKSQRETIEKLLDEGEPEEAYMRLSTSLNFINISIGIKPKIKKKLANWVQKLKGLLQRIADNLNAESYNISLSLTGISAGLSFSV